MISKLCQSQPLTFYTLISLLLWVAAGPSHSLTKEQRADQFLLQAQEAYRDGKHRQAVEAFSRIESLGVSMPAEFHFFYGSSLAETGDHVDALRQLSSYLQLEGSDGRYYQEALRLHGKIEPKAAEAERQRKAAEAERQRKAAEAERQRKAEIQRKTYRLTYGGAEWDGANAIILAPGGGYLVAGSTGSKGAGDKDMWIVKLDDQGRKQWDRTYGGPHADSAHAIVAAPGGGYLVAGLTKSKGAGYKNGWIVKLDDQGHKQWDHTYGVSSTEDEARAIVAAPDGGYLVAGSSYYTASNGRVEADAWIVKLDDQGHKQWDRTYGESSGTDYATAIIQAPGGGYLVAGSTASEGLGETDMWILKLDDQGRLE